MLVGLLLLSAGGLNMSPNSLNFARIVPLAVSKGCLMWLSAGELLFVFMILVKSEMQADNALLDSGHAS